MLRQSLWVLKRPRNRRQNRAFSHQGFPETGRPRWLLSKLWTPTGGVSPVKKETGHDRLVRAGFLRQTQSGIFQLLPFGLRVQQKIEALLDKHMQAIGASRLSLSAFSTEELWRKSGRFDRVAPELFRLSDRRDCSLLLSPTHEEEITQLVAGAVYSQKDLPLRLYQITRKYRDEMRPRHGLLRSREFVMKDLYTFDNSPEAAENTYREVSDAYHAFFADLKLPILVAKASSGDMGGDLSHEYLLFNPAGEETIETCDKCGYMTDDEVMAPQKTNLDPVELSESEHVAFTPPTDEHLDPSQPMDRCACPGCREGSLRLSQALELGHTFYLGTRYSKPLNLSIQLSNESQNLVPAQMGCYGIGVSRILGAVAEHKSDERGLCWPRAIAPFEVVIVPTSPVTAQVIDFYDKLAHDGRLDVVLDDRQVGFGWKMKDADAIGYPVIVVLGRAWREGGCCEVQCRSLGLKESIDVDAVGCHLDDLLNRI